MAGAFYGQITSTRQKQIPITLFRAIYHFYFLRVLPFLGGLISQRSAYQYLPDSVLEFPDRASFKRMMEEAGFSDVKVHDLTCGIAAVHVGTRLS